MTIASRKITAAAPTMRAGGTPFLGGDDGARTVTGGAGKGVVAVGLGAGLAETSGAGFGGGGGDGAGRDDVAGSTEGCFTVAGGGCFTIGGCAGGGSGTVDAMRTVGPAVSAAAFIWTVRGRSSGDGGGGDDATLAAAGAGAGAGSDATEMAAVTSSPIGFGAAVATAATAAVAGAGAATTGGGASRTVSSPTAAPNHEPRQYSRSWTKALAVW
jgi:hypothetical protein